MTRSRFLAAAAATFVALGSSPRTPRAPSRSACACRPSSATSCSSRPGARRRSRRPTSCKYVDAGHYDGGTLHRTVKMDNQPESPIKIEVIQAGVNRRQGQGRLPADRARAHERHRACCTRTARSRWRAARADSATSGWFICINDQPSLDFGGMRNPDGQGFAAFGRVVSGMDVVRKIQMAPSSTDRTTNTEAQKLTPPIKVIKVARVQRAAATGRRRRDGAGCRRAGGRRAVARHAVARRCRRLIAARAGRRRGARSPARRHRRDRDQSRRRRGARPRARLPARRSRSAPPVGAERPAARRQRRRSPISIATACADIVAADAAANRVTWLRQASARARSPNSAIADVAGPAHVHAVDLDGDGDLDLAVASLGVLFPNNARIGAVVAARERRPAALHATRVLRRQDRARGRRARRRSRRRRRSRPGGGAVRLRPGRDALDGEPGRLALRRATCCRSCRARSTPRSPIVDGDGDLDIVTLVSQEWEEIYVFVNDGRGRFTPHADLRRQQRGLRIELDLAAPISTSDGDVDVLYSNGDAFDYAPPSGRPLERRAVAREHRQRGVHLSPHRRLLRRVQPAGRRPRRRRRSRHRGGQRLQRLGRSRGAEPRVARERRPHAVHAARRRQHADAPGHAGGRRPHGRRPARPRHRRHAHELAVQPHVARHASGPTAGPSSAAHP